MGKHTFSKHEKLTKESWIKELFERGSSFNLYPFRLIFRDHPDLESSAHQVLITVSSRNFKRAVDRNSVKRRIREAYRLNKELLITPKKLLLAYIYVAKEILPSAIIHEKLIRANEMIVRRNEKAS